MHFTTYGYKVPDQGDKAKGALGWMQSLGDNINRYDGHNHDGVNSPLISALGSLRFFNAKDYGALGNGIADDTAAIQSTINAAGAAGGRVYIPVGTYLISSALTCAFSNVSFLGDGAASILKCNVTLAYLMYFNSVSNIALSQLAFYGHETAVGGKEGIRFDTVTSFLVENCLFSGPVDATGFNIHINTISSSYGLVTGNTFKRCVGTTSGNGYGVLVSSCSYIKVNHNSFDWTQAGTQGGRHCVYYSNGTHDSEIVGNSMLNSYYESVSLNCLSASQSQMYNILIAANSINAPISTSNATSLEGGIFINGYVAGLSILGNTINGSNNSGIVLQCEQVADYGAPAFVCIADNIITNSAKYGIAISGGSYNLIKGNMIKDVSTLTDQTYSGIFVSDNSESAQGAGFGNVLEGNFIIQTSASGKQMRSGIQISASATNTSLLANTVYPANYFNSLIEDASSTTSRGQIGSRAGVAVGTGFIGEVIETVATTPTNMPGATTVWGNLITRSLTAGTYLISAVVEFQLNTATCTKVSAALTLTTAGSGTEGDTQFSNYPPSSSVPVTITIPGKKFDLSSTVNLYLTGAATYSAGNPQYVARITAVRIA